MPSLAIGKNREVKTFVPFPLYNYRIYIIFTDSLEATAENLVVKGHLTKNHGIDDTTDGFHVRMPNQSFSYIVLPFTAGINEIAHECYHCIVNMFRWINAAHEEELFAYHLGYLVKLVVEDQKKALTKREKSGIMGILDETR